jgi:tRNA A37 methylthiotransferase MiaB
MNRACDMNKIKKMLINLKAANPSLHLITSIIVSFPSETKRELGDTIQFCKDVGFDQIYCHGYSARPGIKSLSFPGQHSEKLISKRLKYTHEWLGSQVACVTDPSQKDVYVKGEFQSTKPK